MISQISAKAMLVTAFVLSLLFKCGCCVDCSMRTGSTCICDMSDGSGFLDFTPISKSDGTPFFKDFKSGRWAYSWNPCTAFQEGSCKTKVAICQSSRYVGGRQDKVKFTISSTNPLKGSLAYEDGDVMDKTPRSGVINFQCDASKEHDFAAHGENPRGHYIMSLTSKHACVQKPPPPSPTTHKPPPPSPTASPTTAGHHHQSKDNPISLGTILDICALMVLMTYLVGGAAFMRFRKGAEGKDMMPNADFWLMLPGLIKDGGKLIIGKVRGLRGSQPGYESI